MNHRKPTWGDRAKSGGRRVAKSAVLLAVGISLIALPSAVASTPLPNNSVTGAHVQNGSLTSADMNPATHAAYMSTKPGADQIDSTGQIKPDTIDKTDLNPALRAEVEEASTPGADGKSYGCDGNVVDAKHPAATCPGTPGAGGAQGDKGEPGDPATDAKGAILVDETFAPTVVTKIGGPFAANATLVGTVTLPAGKLKVDLDGFWITNAAGPAGTRPQLAARAPGKDLGTIFPGEASPTANREITGHDTTGITLTEPTEVSIYAFGYNDDTSAAGGGRLVVTASVLVTRG